MYPGLRRTFADMYPMFLLRAGRGDRNLAFVRDPTAKVLEEGIDDDQLPTFEYVVQWHRDHIDGIDGAKEFITPATLAVAMPR